jgi:hypothetical protein
VFVMLHYKELHNLYLMQNVISDQIKEGDMCVACSTYGETINAHKILGGKPKGKCPLRRPMHKWEDNMLKK